MKWAPIHVERAAPKRPAEDRASIAAAPQTGTGPSVFDGFLIIAHSPYFAGPRGLGRLWVAGTFLYFMQIDVARAASSDPATRTRNFETLRRTCTLGLQFLATGHDKFDGHALEGLSI